MAQPSATESCPAYHSVQPAPVESLGSGEGEQGDPRPSPPRRGEEHAGIEDQEVDEERRGAIDARVEDDGRQEAPHGRQRRQRPGVEPERGREGDGRHDRHPQERRRRPHERVERVRGVEREMEDTGRDGDQALRGHAVRVAVREPNAARQHGDPGGEACQDSPGRADPLVLEGVLEEEADTEHQQDPADARQPGSAEPPLPLTDARRGERRRGAGRDRGHRLRIPLGRGRGGDRGRRIGGDRGDGECRLPRRAGRIRCGGRRHGRLGRGSRRRARRRGGCRRSRPLLELGQAGLEPAHAAPETQERQHQHEDDERAGEEEEPEPDQRDDR